jgi:hypothetical protein
MPGNESHYETKFQAGGHQDKWRKPSSNYTSHTFVCYKKVWTRYEIFMCIPTNFDGHFFQPVIAFSLSYGGVGLKYSFHIDDSAMTRKIVHVLSTPFRTFDEYEKFVRQATNGIPIIFILFDIIFVILIRPYDSKSRLGLYTCIQECSMRIF